MVLFSLVTFQGRIKPLLPAGTSYAVNITIYGPPREDFSSNQKAIEFDAWYITIHYFFGDGSNVKIYLCRNECSGHVGGTCHVHGGQDKSVAIRCELADIDDILVFMYTHLRIVVVLPATNNNTSSWETERWNLKDL